MTRRSSTNTRHPKADRGDPSRRPGGSDNGTDTTAERSNTLQSRGPDKHSSSHSGSSSTSTTTSTDEASPSDRRAESARASLSARSSAATLASRLSSDTSNDASSNPHSSPTSHLYPYPNTGPRYVPGTCTGGKLKLRTAIVPDGSGPIHAYTSFDTHTAPLESKYQSRVDKLRSSKKRVRFIGEDMSSGTRQLSPFAHAEHGLEVPVHYKDRPEDHTDAAIGKCRSPGKNRRAMRNGWSAYSRRAGELYSAAGIKELPASQKTLRELFPTIARIKDSDSVSASSASSSVSDTDSDSDTGAEWLTEEEQDLFETELDAFEEGGYATMEDLQSNYQGVQDTGSVAMLWLGKTERRKNGAAIHEMNEDALRLLADRKTFLPSSRAQLARWLDNGKHYPKNVDSLTSDPELGVRTYLEDIDFDKTPWLPNMAELERDTIESKRNRFIKIFDKMRLKRGALDTTAEGKATGVAYDDPRSMRLTDDEVDAHHPSPDGGETVTDASLYQMQAFRGISELIRRDGMDTARMRKRVQQQLSSLWNRSFISESEWRKRFPAMSQTARYSQALALSEEAYRAMDEIEAEITAAESSGASSSIIDALRDEWESWLPQSEHEQQWKNEAGRMARGRITRVADEIPDDEDGRRAAAYLLEKDPSGASLTLESRLRGMELSEKQLARELDAVNEKMGQELGAAVRAAYGKKGEGEAGEGDDKAARARAKAKAKAKSKTKAKAEARGRAKGNGGQSESVGSAALTGDAAETASTMGSAATAA